VLLSSLFEGKFMNYQKSLVTAGVVGVLALSGCAGGEGFAGAATTPSPTPTKTVPANGDHFSSVVTLKNAFVGAGGDCSSFQETNKVTRAAESGDCGTGTVLSVYSSVSDRDAVVDGQKQFADMIGMNLLVGENWIVNDKNVAQYQPKLGGTLVTRTATK
jgi:hypothetical protein